MAQTDTFVFWSTNEGPGWMYLLPPLGGLRLLCVDIAGAVAWALARECRQLTLLSAGSVWPAPDRRAGRPAAALPVVQIDELLAQAQAPGFERFDGLVIHDPLGERLHQEGLAPLQRLLLAADKLLQQKGWVYLGANNPYSLQRWRERMRGTPSTGRAPLRPSKLKSLLRNAGAAEIRVHPYLMANGRVAEVVPAEGYCAMKNREARGERLKEWLFGRRGAPRLAPAVGLLALRDAATPSMLDALARRVGALRQAAATPAGSEPPVVKQYLVFAGHKAIVAAGPRGRSDQDVIAVLTADAVSTRGRNLEAPHLQALTRIASVSTLVPRLIDRFDFDHTSCVVMERIPGVTLDQDLPPLERVTDAALDFLIRLHLETAVPTAMDEPGFDRLAAPLLQAATERNPDFAAAIATWGTPLRKRLRSLTLPAVFQHGDFKVENVIYEPGTCRLLSVIDWEHARRPGLPLLDLMYLLVYNRVIRGANWIEAIERPIVREEWTASEQRRLERYLTALGLGADALPALRALFLAHHVGCRIHLPADPALRAKIAEMLNELGRIIGQPVDSLAPHQ
ncbi:MAG: phosphotransferase [Pseudomonadota bacterium]